MSSLLELLPENWPILLATFAGAVIGFLGCCLFSVRNYSRGFRDGQRTAERRIHARLVQDRRDDTPLSHPVTR